MVRQWLAWLCRQVAGIWDRAAESFEWEPFEYIEPTADQVNNDVVQVLCRVFDDGADVAMDEWREFYDPSRWFSHHRALGAFIRWRLDNMDATGRQWFQALSERQRLGLRFNLSGIEYSARRVSLQAAALGAEIDELNRQMAECADVTHTETHEGT